MPLFPLAFTTLAILVPAVLHRWEQVGVSPHLPAREWARGLWAVVLALILSFAAGLFALSVGRGQLSHIVPLAAIFVLLFPWQLTRYLLVPLGAWRAAWHLAQLAGWVWRGDVPGGQLVAGAWALRRRRIPDPEAIAWLVSQRDGLVRLEAAGLLGSALLADALGDRRGAREMMRMIEDFHEAHRPPMTRFLANEWRVADAAQRGDWREVEQLGRSPQRRSRLTRLLGEVAARLRGDPPVPSDARLVLLWLLAPKRRMTLGLLRRALAQPRLDGSAELGPLPAPPTGPSGASLLVRHGAALGSGGLPARELIALARSWERQLADPQLRRATTRRAVTLRAGDPEAALARLRREVEEDLTQLARAGAVSLAALEPASEDCPALRRVSRELRHEMLDELAIVSESLDARVRAQREVEPLAELRDFLRLRALYERTCTLGGPELVRIAFCQVHDPLSNQAVWLWQRDEAASARAMFRWLGHEATVAGDDEAAELQRRNDACVRC